MSKPAFGPPSMGNGIVGHARGVSEGVLSWHRDALAHLYAARAALREVSIRRIGGTRIRRARMILAKEIEHVETVILEGERDAALFGDTGEGTP